MSILIIEWTEYIDLYIFILIIEVSYDFVRYENLNSSKAIINWEAKKTIEDMCADSWRWQSKNPNGYENSIEEEGADRWK